MGVVIAVEPRPDDVEDVDLGGSEYVFAYPKVSPLLNAMQRAQGVKDREERGDMILTAQNQWLAAGFGPEQWAHIQSRLDDLADPLDFRHILALFEALFQKAANGRPPTSPGGSSTGSSGIGSLGDARSPLGSMRGSSPLDALATS